MSAHTADARAYVGPLRDELEEPGARCAKAHALHLIGLVERLADALDAARAELARRDDLTAAYAALVDDWNALVAGLGAAGVAVVGSAPGPGWAWAAGGQAGQADTLAAAYLAALAAVGVRPPVAPPPRAVDPAGGCFHCGLPLLGGGILDQVILTRAGRRCAAHRVCADYLTTVGWRVEAIARAIAPDPKES